MQEVKANAEDGDSSNGLPPPRRYTAHLHGPRNLILNRLDISHTPGSAGSLVAKRQTIRRAQAAAQSPARRLAALAPNRLEAHAGTPLGANCNKLRSAGNGKTALGLQLVGGVFADVTKQAPAAVLRGPLDTARAEGTSGNNRISHPC